MSEPLLFTIDETIQALRIARAAREYVLRSEEFADLLVKSEKPLDPKIELRTSEAWGRLLEAVKAPKTGPPGKKQGVRVDALRQQPRLIQITTGVAGQAISPKHGLTNAGTDP